MARTVHCIKLGQDAEGLDFPPYPGEMGKRLWESVSKQAWADWLKHQTMLVNENRLNLPTRAPANIWRARWSSTSLAAAPMPCRATCRLALERIWHIFPLYGASCGAFFIDFS